MRRIPPALFLFFLAPAIGELLSGSAPPVEFFNPFALLILSALYGSGAILARELSLSWNKRWPTILTLGLAYGFLKRASWSNLSSTRTGWIWESWVRMVGLQV